MTARHPRTLTTFGTRAALVASLVVVACRKETIHKPEAPAMSDVVAAFAAPTGTFDASVTAAVRAAIDDAASGVIGHGVQDLLFRAINDGVVGSQGEQTETTSFTTALGDAPRGPSGAAVSPQSFDGDGFAQITRVCDGWSATPTPDEAANGHLDLTFTFSKINLDPVIWGDATRCHYLTGGKRLSLDRGESAAALRLYVGENTKVADLAKTPVVLALDLIATLDDKPIPSKLAVRFVYQSAAVELLVPVPDGDVVVTVTAGNALQVRAKNGTFQCDAATKRCKGQANVEVSL